MNEADWPAVHLLLCRRLNGEQLSHDDLKFCVRAFHADEVRYDALMRSVRRQL